MPGAVRMFTSLPINLYRSNPPLEVNLPGLYLPTIEGQLIDHRESLLHDCVLCGRGGVRPSSGETVPFHRDFTSKPFKLVFILVFDYANANIDFHTVRFSPILADILSNRLILKQTAKLYVAQK